MKKNQNWEEKVITAAQKAAQKAYAPYSKFRVGCALLHSDQKIVIGFNIENAVLGETICAERVALFVSKTQDYKKEDQELMVIFNEGNKLTFPCGACRQTIWELANHNLKIILVNGKNEQKSATIFQLLPFGFDKSFF